MSKTQLFGKLRHHEISEMAIMISDDSLRDSESCDDMIEYEHGCSFFGIIECRHRLGPLCEIIHGYNNVSIPLSQVRVKSHEIDTPFRERSSETYRV